jgi:hypothetical protein
MTQDNNNDGTKDTGSKGYQFRFGKFVDDGKAKTDGSELGIVNPNFHSSYKPE